MLRQTRQSRPQFPDSQSACEKNDIRARVMPFTLYAPRKPPPQISIHRMRRKRDHGMMSGYKFQA